MRQEREFEEMGQERGFFEKVWKIDFYAQFPAKK